MHQLSTPSPITPFLAGFLIVLVIIMQTRRVSYWWRSS
jgi:hypothetical protein